LPWFRRRKKSQEEAAPPEAAAIQEAPPAEPAEQPANVAATPGETEAEAARKKRRRGTRGGRGRKKPGEAAAVSAESGDAEAPEKPKPKERQKREARPERKQSERSSRSSARRRQPPRRAPLPAAKRELVMSTDVGEQRVAVLEDGRVAEVYLERPERRSIAGNIYLGTVDNVLPGMEAAFVEIGLEKNGFLYVDEIVVPELEGKRHGKKITDLISRGQTLLVQAVKDPMKTKGARLTTEISLPGRFLVYVPNGEGLGVSRRLDDAERDRLKGIIKAIAPKEGGVIVRTAAEGASAEDIERDLVFLQRLWKTVQTRAKQATAPSLVYQEAELPLRVVRDLFAGDFVAAHIDHDRTYRRIVGYLKKTSPHMLERVHRYKDKPPLFEAYGVEAEIRSTLHRRVDLPSGGYLIFDYAEAFTVIDVNTGRFVGSRSKSSNARLEDTIVKNNLEAVKEVVRQLRLRDIGGIIVIDFIDMANPKNRETVEAALRDELERDRTKTYVVEISPLGLVEMTRQNVTDGPREILTRKCPTCEGDGIVVSERTYAMTVERRLRDLAAGSRAQAFRIELHPRVLALLAGPGGSRLAEIEAAARKRFYLTPAEGGHVHLDHLQVLAEGKRDDLAPQSPVAEDAELDLKLVEVDRHDASSAVGKLDGVDVVVAGAAKLVGKKAKVRVGRVLDGAAYAQLLTADAPDSPITFESEAEKPTRAPARSKQAAATEEETPLAEEDEEEEVLGEADADTEAAEADEPESVEVEAAGDDGQPVKKKTRRGSRGGRRRKKKPATESAVADGEPGAELSVEAGGSPAAELEAAAETTPSDSEPAETEEAAAAPKPRRRRAPKIHVPAADLGEEAPEGSSGNGAQPEAVADDSAVEERAAEGDATGVAPAKRKTRRGTRGGRSRKRKTTPVDEANGADGPEAVEAEPEPAPAPEPPAEDASAEDFGYVPMSEWLDDLERERG
jgi:ribonuclease G